MCKTLKKSKQTPQSTGPGIDFDFEFLQFFLEFSAGWKNTESVDCFDRCWLPEVKRKARCAEASYY